MALRPASSAGSSSTALFGATDRLLGEVSETPAAVVRHAAGRGCGLSARGPNLVKQLLRREDVSVKRELLTLEVATAAVSSAHPGDAALGQGLVRRVVDAVPLEPHELAVKHDDRPCHRHTRLGDQSPPV